MKKMFEETGCDGVMIGREPGNPGSSILIIDGRSKRNDHLSFLRREEKGYERHRALLQSYGDQEH
jgi:tRNA-dihydrouridine synthase